MAKALGQYELLAKLATGGMGEIYIARLVGPAGFERLVVIKQMLPHLENHERAIAMFVEEASLAARISHPNVCQVHELGVSDGKYFLVMEYLEGVALSRCEGRLHASHSLADARLLIAIAQQTCEGLQHIHQATNADGTPAHIIHRDVSPQNLFVTASGMVKILDFGIAKRQGSQLKTRTGALIGKVCYMAPEQILGAPIDARTDVFALGAVLFEQATGRPLFRRDSDFLTLKAITEEVMPSFPRDGHLAHLAPIVMRALARDPAERFASARDMGKALADAGDKLGGGLGTKEIAGWIDRQFGAELRQRRELLHSLADPTVVDEPPVVADESIVPVPLDQRSAFASWRTESVRPQPTPEYITRSPHRSRWWLVAILIAGLGAAAFGLWLATPRDSVPARAATNDRFDAATRTAVEVAIDASTPLPEPRVEPNRVAEPTRVREPTRPQRARKPPPAVLRGGYLTIHSQPYAEISIDGTYVDVTPLPRHSLTAGSHRVRAQTRDGRTKTFTVRIVAGEEVTKRLKFD